MSGLLTVQIWSMDRFGTHQQQLTTVGSQNSYPAVSPDGTKIAFSSNRDGNPEIYVMNANGTNQTRLTNTGASDYTPAWSPDGTKIAFASFGSDYDIWVMDANGANPVNLTNHPSQDMNPSWQPGGSKIAFDTNRDGQNEIYVINSNGTGPTNLTNTASRDEWGPDWSPSGAMLLFSGLQGSAGGIYRMNANGSGVVLMTSQGDTMPAWSPDGTRIVFASYNRDLNFELYVMDADGSHIARLTNNAPPGNSLPEDAHPDWQAVASASLPDCDLKLALPNGSEVDGPLTVETWQNFFILGHDFPPSIPLQLDFTNPSAWNRYLRRRLRSHGRVRGVLLLRARLGGHGVDQQPVRSSRPERVQRLRGAECHRACRAGEPHLRR